MPDVLQSVPKCLAIFTDLSAWRFSARTKIPGGKFQFGRVAFSQTEPKFLAIVTNMNARLFSVGTKIPGSFYEF